MAGRLAVQYNTDTVFLGDLLSRSRPPRLMVSPTGRRCAMAFASLMTRHPLARIRRLRGRAGKAKKRCAHQRN